jgi:uncharacterized protein YjbJ (UPF0337 family)
MNPDTFKDQWKLLKGELKWRWSKLTEEDLRQVDGDFSKFISFVQLRYECARDKALREFERWYEALRTSSAPPVYRPG